MGKRIIRFIRFIFNCILEVIYSGDEICELCGDLLIEEDTYICKSCKQKIILCEDISSIYENKRFNFKVYSSCYYGREVRELIINLKYKSNFSCGKVLVEFMSKIINKNNIKFDIVTFIPMYYKDEAKRGFNQSKYLAMLISKMKDKRLVKTLVKTKQTKDQIGLSGKERWENLEECFEAVHINKFAGKKVLIIDDVITTGATAYCAAEKLIKNGAKEVSILTAAKSKL